MRFKVTENSPRTGLRLLPEVKLTTALRKIADDLAFRTAHTTEVKSVFNPECYITLPKNVTYVGAGLYRDAYRFGEYVFKVDEFAASRKGGNLTEKFFLDKLREDGWGWFAPHAAVIPAGKYTVSVTYYVPFDRSGAEDEWWDHEYISELEYMLRTDYGYMDGHGYNLVVNSRTNMPVLLDAGHAWGFKTPRVSKHEILQRYAA